MDESAFRKKARNRAVTIAGTGYALLGYPRRAYLSYAFALVVAVSVFAVIFRPEPVPFWVAVGLVALSTILVLIEVIAVSLLEIRRTSKSGSGSLHFAIVALITGFIVAGLGLSVILSFGSMMMAGGGMAPVVLHGERFMYHKHVEPDKLVPGGLVTFGVSKSSAWGRPGEIVFARILAMPGDKLAQQNGRYLINGKEGPIVSPTQAGPVPVIVPEAPESVIVPPDCFFVVQEQPAQALDSQSLSWARRPDIISSKHWLVSSRGLLQPLR